MHLGVGVGLRSEHFPEILSGRPAVSWFEAITENFLPVGNETGGRPLAVMERIRADHPVVFHGVSLSIGSVDPVDRGYLARIGALFRRFEPAMVSDHLCWTGAHGTNLHDLLPLPYTEEALAHVVRKVGEVQELLGRRILLENVSSYLTFEHSEMKEWEFLSEVARRADCRILLDVNNVYVSATNHGFDAKTYLDAVPRELVAQFHLAGHSDKGRFLFDTHDHPVPDPVWALYRHALARFGRVPTLIEWDDKLPDLAGLLAEARIAERHVAEVLGPEASP